MRAGVSTVQQTLTPEASNVLKHAIADAQRRGHAQVTPLHVASTLLTASGSLLRQACIQSHVHSPHTPKCRGLELCFNVALDRLATLQGSHISSAQPSLSNALIAALKRAQAHQRRGYPEQQQVPLLAVKVEMEQLIISILDDPSVSRVMREASFSSTQIKNCLEEAMGSTPQTQQQSRIGSVNMDRLRLKLGSGEHMGFNLAGFGSPFRHGSSIHAGGADPRSLGGYGTSFEREKFPGLQFGMPERNFKPLNFLSRGQDLEPATNFKPLNFLSRGQDLEPATFNAQDMKNVIDILLKSKKKNPVLIGERTLGTSLSKELMQRLDKSDVPGVLHGVKLLLYNLSFMSNFHSKEEINQKMKELGKAVEDCMPTGAIVFLGDLQWLVQKPLPQNGCFTFPSCNPTQHLVSELGKLYAAHEASGRLWFVGAASSQTYLHCQTWHPSLESQWDLQPVHTATILNLRARFGIHASETMARAKPCKQTALDEAVFFCADCKAKCEEEEHNFLQETEGTDVIAKEGAKDDIPFWLKERKEFAYQQNGSSKKDRTHVEKVQEIQQKWSQHCQTLHKQSCLPGVVNVFDNGTSLTQPPPVLCANGKASKGLLSQSVATSSMPTWLMLHSKSGPSCPVSLSSTTSSNGSMRVHDQILTNNNVEIGSSGSSPQASISLEDKVSLKLSPPSFDGKPSSLPVKTDLVLGRSNEKDFGDTNVIREDYRLNLHKERVKDVPACTSSMKELLFPSISSVTAQSPSVMEARPVNRGENAAHLYVDPSSFKDLCKKLSERVPWQKEAISRIASTVMECRSGLGRRRGLSMKGDTWLLLLGPDLIGKQQIAKGIAEFLFGCSKKVVSLTLKTKHGMHFTDEGGNTACRGKTHLDMVVEAVRRDPSSVILIEDIDNADRITKNTLFRAMERGRLAGLNGREVSVSNSVIIMASNRGVSNLTKRDRRIAGLDEGGLINLRGTGLKLLLDKATDSASCVHINGPVSIAECSKETNPGGKRKFDWEDDVSHHQAAEKRNKCETRGMDLDLNLSLDQSQTSTCSSESDIDALKVFAEEFLPRDFCKLIDEIIMFQPFDFDGLVDRILESIASVVKSKEVSIEIDVQVIQQLVSIVWKASLQQDVLDKWSEQVLGDAVSKLLGEKRGSTDLVVKLVAVGKDGKKPTSDMDLLPKEIELEM